jgi:hypothetical protein
MNPPLLAPRGRPVARPSWLDKRTDREKILDTNYLLSPGNNKKSNYFTNVTYSRVHEFLNRCGESFNILIIGDHNNKDGFYAIPYVVLKPCLDDKYITHSHGRKAAWVVTIRKHQLKVTKGGPSLDVRDYFGNRANLTSFCTHLGTGQDGPKLQRTEAEIIEGRRLLKLHKFTERKTQIVRRKKKAVLAATGRLVCEACDFDFVIEYGKLGEGFAECHHRSPLAELDGEAPTRLEDLAIVCSNCHRMLHRSRPMLRVEELRSVVRQRRSER